MELANGLALCQPPYDEPIESIGERIANQKKLPLVRDFDLSTNGVTAQFVRLGLPDTYVAEIESSARQYVSNLRPRMPVYSLRASEFNLIASGGQNLTQAVTAYTWIIDLLTSPDEQHWTKELRTVIDAGKELNPFLARSLDCPIAAIRKMHQLPRNLLDPDANIRARLSILAKTLHQLTASEHPQILGEWNTLNDAATWAFHHFGEPFRTQIATRAYRAWIIKSHGAFESQFNDDDGILSFKSFLINAVPNIEMRSADGDERPLSDFMLEWYAEVYGPSWMRKALRRLDKKCLKLSKHADLQLPHLDTGFFYWGDGLEMRCIVPISRGDQMKMEGALQKNCLGKLIGKAIVREWCPFFSIRDRRGSIKAHLEIGNSQGIFHLVQIKGYANSVAGDASQQAAVEFIEYLNYCQPSLKLPEQGLAAHHRRLISIDVAIERATRRWNLKPLAYGEFE